MSWMKRAQGAAGPGAGPQPYAAAPPAQPFPNQQNMYPNYPGATGNAPTQAAPQPQYWAGGAPSQPPQQHQQQFNQQYAQVYQPDFPPNANQVYHQPTQYNHNYPNPGYTNPQQNYQQNYYQNQPVQQSYPPNTTKNDGWEDNWDWGWDESAKQAQKAQNAAQHQNQAVKQEQVFHNANNANVLEDSFAPTNTWNWAMDDKKESKNNSINPTIQDTNEAANLPSNPVENNTTPEPNVPYTTNNSASMPTEEVRTLSDRDAVKERMPNLALGKRFHLDNLTPQWSIESQMSQESSDGVQTHSESTYRSENQSRNSTSPGPNTDNSNFNYSQSGLDEGYNQNSEWSRQSDELTLAESAPTGSRRDSHNELSYALQDLSIANHENILTENVQVNQSVELRTSQQNMSGAQPPPAPSPASVLPPPPAALPPPPAALPPPPAALPPPPLRPPSAGLTPTPTPAAAGHLAPPPANASRPPSSLSPASLPPPNFPAPSNSQNPFKHAGPFAHKSKSSSSSAPGQPFGPQGPAAGLASPAVVGKISQLGRTPVGFEANLETTPDNSERPDHPQMSAYRPASVPHQVPDNLEVAPQNDRNEYLQTAHLSSGDYGENTDFARGAPPPGLRRMVVGQQESEYGPSANVSGDEPPPGLARMVPGQQTEGDAYMERLIDGQPTDGGRPYRAGRRPMGLDRMVPGEPSGAEYPQYQGSAFASGNEQRVVTGLERDFRADAGPADVREHNVDGSDYSEPAERQREGTMEGENLQDLSAVSSADLSFRERDAPPESPPEPERPAAASRRSSDDTDRDRPFDASPRRARRRTSRDRAQDDRYKYERDDRKAPRDERRSDKERRERRERRERHGSPGARRHRDDSPDARRQRDESPDARRQHDGSPDTRRQRDDSPDARRKRNESPDGRRQRHGSPGARRQRRSARAHRYETEDTDYHSDRERRRRREGREGREGSYAARPPRPADEDAERRRARRERSERAERPERAYRAIDPSRKYGPRRREREEERRRVTFSRDAKANDSSRSEGEVSPASRSESREATATDEEPERRRARHASRRAHEHYYGEYAAAHYGDPYSAQRQQYEYYSRLRAADPAAYMLVYKQLMAGRAPEPRKHHDLMEGYGGYEARGDERGSVHSGRSSAAAHKGNDTYYVFRREGSLRGAASLRTDVSDRDLTTEVSLPTNLDSSTARSERMTPHRFSTAHVKGSVSSRHVVVVRPSWPVDGAPATVQVVSLAALLARDPLAACLARTPGPLVHGVTHKKTVIEYCETVARARPRHAARDPAGHGLLWDLLALLLRQNGVVVGSDIAELLMKNIQEYEYKPPTSRSTHNGSRRPSEASEEAVELLAAEHMHELPPSPAVDEKAALDKLREHLIYGNRQEALEWALSCRLWGHALALAGPGGRARGAVCARFLAATPRRDPLHSLYAALHHHTPPAATCVSEERWADWREHAAILLSNPTRPDHDTKTLTTLGDSLASRGLVYCAQFCYLTGGVPFARHPLAPLAATAPPAAPPRLSLLFADARAGTLAQLATPQAIVATEIYEYALSLNRDYVIPELQVYKLLTASRLADCGQYERALAYVEQAARAVSRAPRDYSAALASALAALADRLQPQGVDEAPLDEGEGEGSPRDQWLRDVRGAAHMLQAEASQHASLHASQHASLHASPHHAATDYCAAQQQQQQQQYSWDQAPPYQQQPTPPYVEPEETADYAQQYYQQGGAPPPAPPAALAPPSPGAPQYEDWNRTEEHHAQAYADAAYWRGDNYGYGEGAEGADGAEGAEGARPQITMPGAARARTDQQDTPAATEREESAGAARAEARSEGAGRGGGGGGGGGWLGGILTKLSLRPPNQMILPDDKNPSIVWDAEHKRWRDVDGESPGGAAEPPPPPPRSQDLPHSRNASTPLHSAPGAPPGAPPPVSNIFKMQKGRHIKKSYVDVFNPGGASSGPAPAPAPPAPAPLPPAPAYFVPEPAPQSGVYTPEQAQGAEEPYRSAI